MKTLLLLRHAKSSWESPAKDDFDRPLAPRGERDAPRVGKMLAHSDTKLDLVVSSPATRARRTAEIVAAAAKYKGTVRFEGTIYEASAGDLLAVIRGLPDDANTVMLVGHNPGFEHLVGGLIASASHPARVRVPTAALACVELEAENWGDANFGGGTLRWLLIPRQLG